MSLQFLKKVFSRCRRNKNTIGLRSSPHPVRLWFEYVILAEVLNRKIYPHFERLYINKKDLMNSNQYIIILKIRLKGTILLTNFRTWRWFFTHCNCFLIWVSAVPTVLHIRLVTVQNLFLRTCSKIQNWEKESTLNISNAKTKRSWEAAIITRSH